MRCGNCGQRLEGLPDDVIFPCVQCRVAWCLGEGSLAPRALELFQLGEEGLAALPFWMLDAEVEIRRRITRLEEYASPVELTKQFETAGERGLKETSEPPRRETVFVPAFLCDRPLFVGRKVSALELVQTDLGGRSTRAPGGCITAEDAMQLGEGIVVAEEASGRGHLAMLDLRVTAVHLRVALLGCRIEDQGFRVAGQALLLPYTAIADSDGIIGFPGASRS